MTILAKRQSITYIILFILLAFRFSTSIASLIAHSHFSTETIPDWMGQFEKWSYLIFLLGSFPLMTVVMILHRDNLRILNMDRPFMLIFLCSGLPIILESYAVNWLAGILQAVVAIWIIYGLWSNKFVFGDISPNIWWSFLFVISIFVISLIVISSSLNIPKIEQYALYFFSDTIPNSTYEEVIYRGILWMFLSDMKLSEWRIFLFQAFYFGFLI